jgi:hypothetical protein
MNVPSPKFNEHSNHLKDLVKKHMPAVEMVQVVETCLVKCEALSSTPQDCPPAPRPPKANSDSVVEPA